MQNMLLYLWKKKMKHTSTAHTVSKDIYNLAFMPTKRKTKELKKELKKTTKDNGFLFQPNDDGHVPRDMVHAMELGAGTEMSEENVSQSIQHFPAHSNGLLFIRPGTAAVAGTVDVGLVCSKEGPKNGMCKNMKELLRGLTLLLSMQVLPVNVRVTALVDKADLVEQWDTKVVKWCKGLQGPKTKGKATLRVAYLGVKRGGGGRVDRGPMSENLLE